MIVKDEVIRDEKSHTYWKAGAAPEQRVVGFSELIRAHRYVESAKFAKPEHLRRGKNAHLAIHYFEKGKLGVGGGLKVESLSPLIRPYFESYRKLYELFKPKIIHTEVVVYDGSAGGLACQLDSVWQFQGSLAVIDWKTGAVADWVKYQTGAAVNGLNEKVQKQYRRFGAQLMDDGSMAKLREFTDPNDMPRVRMLTATFYTWVADGVYPWARTLKEAKSERSESNGNGTGTTIDDLFPHVGAGSGGEIRDSETAAGAAAAE